MIVGYNHATVTPAACLAGGNIFLDGFGENCVFHGFHPHLFGEKPTMPEPQRSEILAKLSWVWSTNKYLGILSGESIMYQYEDEGEVVAVAIYNYPSDQRAKMSWGQWAYYWAYKLVFKARLSLFHRELMRTYFTNAAQNDFIRQMYSFGNTPQEEQEYRKSLATKSYEQLKEARYPVNDTLYLNILSVKRNTHGKGYGSKLLNGSLEYFNLQGPTFTNGQQQSRGPAKASLIPSPGNDTFYARYGFKTSVDRPIKSSDGRAACDAKYMEKVL